MPIVALLLTAHSREIGLNHLLHKVVEADFMVTAEPLPCLGRIVEQEVDLTRTEIARIDFDQPLS
jgi:hypothetical protein